MRDVSAKTQEEITIETVNKCWRLANLVSHSKLVSEKTLKRTAQAVYELLTDMEVNEYQRKSIYKKFMNGRNGMQ